MAMTSFGILFAKWRDTTKTYQKKTFNLIGEKTKTKLESLSLHFLHVV